MRWRPKRRGIEKNEERDDDLEVAEEAPSLRDGVLEVAEGTDEDDADEGLGARSRLMAAGLNGVVLSSDAAGCTGCSTPSISSPSSSCFAASDSSSEVSYFSQSSSTNCNPIGFLFSRLAERHSKQYAHWAVLAMLNPESKAEM